LLASRFQTNTIKPVLITVLGCSMLSVVFSSFCINPFLSSWPLVDVYKERRPSRTTVVDRCLRAAFSGVEEELCRWLVL
jgi:hypothetical protein